MSFSPPPITYEPDTVEVITGTCMRCGNVGSVKVLRKDFDRWQNGAYVQDAFPELPAPLREQLINGIHPKCWDAIMGVEGGNPTPV